MRGLFSKKKLVIGAALLLFLLLLNLGSQSVRGMFSSFLAPLQSSLWQVGNQSAGRLSGSSPQELKLQAENLSLAQELLALKDVEKENERLREALKIAPREKLDLSFAEIIGKEVQRDVLIVNKGAAEGVKQGMPVVTQGKVAVGIIGEVFSHTSKVLLLSLRDFALDVKIGGKEVIGVLKGQGRYRVLLDLIPQEEELKEGDTVVTSALGGTFPGNLLVGDVKSVEKSDLTAFQGGKVELYFHPKKQDSLFIIKNYP